MTFCSILYEKAEDGVTREPATAPVYFADLNLDQVVDAITAGKADYNLPPFFYTPLSSAEAIAYRQEVMQELEAGPLLECVKTFAAQLRATRQHLARATQIHYAHHQQGWFLEAAAGYGEAVDRLARELAELDLRSRGFRAFRDYLAAYSRSARFTALLTTTRQLKASLSAVRYGLLIQGNYVRVRQYGGEADYSEEVAAAFARFKQGPAREHDAEARADHGINHVEAGILERVAKLYPDLFAALENFCAQNRDYLDATIARFDREAQFYIAYLDYIATLRERGLAFCYPRITTDRKEIHSRAGFDLALAHALISRGAPVVVNDFQLSGAERIIVVSGPNQGGKTTFARTFGQLHYLACLGCPVPGTDAQVFLFDALFTHFEKEERVTDRRGKLHDDLVRLRGILEQATPRSIILLNEIFTSTAVQDAVFLSRELMTRIIRLDALCVWVTFIVELASLSATAVSMVSTVVPDNPAQRTYKIVRKPADGLSYALSLAEKHRVTYPHLRERLGL